MGRIRIIVIIWIVCFYALPSIQAQKIYFSTTPFMSANEQTAIFLPFMDYLSKSLGKECIYIHSDNYQSLQKKISNNEIQLALIGTVGFLDILENHRMVAVAKTIRNNKSQYRSSIIVAAQTSFTKIQDLQGCSFAFVDRKSAAGYYLPIDLFKEHGINPLKFFRSITYVGSHDKLVAHVARGDIDAGATFQGAQSLLANPQAIKVIAQTKPIPSDPFIVSNTLTKEQINKIVISLLNIGANKENKIFLDITNIDGFMPATNKEYKEYFIFRKSLQ